MSVPRVLAWSSRSDSSVEAEYILEERASGVRLGSLWHQWPRESKLELIRQITDIENSLSSIEFSTHGCIYFKEDLPVDTKSDGRVLLNSSISRDILDRFAIGPLTTAELWKSGRGDMDLDRGPCKLLSFVRFTLSSVGSPAYP